MVDLYSWERILSQRRNRERFNPDPVGRKVSNWQCKPLFGPELPSREPSLIILQLKLTSYPIQWTNLLGLFPKISLTRYQYIFLQGIGQFITLLMKYIKAGIHIIYIIKNKQRFQNSPALSKTEVETISGPLHARFTAGYSVRYPLFGRIFD